MFGTYLRRELAGRRKQTVIIAIGLALAIALVMIVNSVASGVKDAQSQVLKSVYGVGTDITVTKAAKAPTPGSGGPGGRFDFGSGSGKKSSDGRRKVSQSRLSVGFGTSTMKDSVLTTVKNTDGVSAAAAVLSLQNTSFSGKLPDFGQGGQGNGGQPGQPPAGGTSGQNGQGNSSFSIKQTTVLGITPGAKAVGPIASTELGKGRTLKASDEGKHVAVLDASYAKSKKLSVGDTIKLGGKKFKVIGTVTSTGSDSTTTSNAYIPLDVAQSLSGEKNKITTVYVSANSASDVDAVKASLDKAMPSATVSTEADLASSASGSLSSASKLVSNLGTWLSIIVLAAAFLIAILFTISGVTRRTREFGTLKALGWSNRRVVGQVTGESIVQGIIGGIVGIAVGLIGVLVINLVSPSLSGAVSGAQGAGGGAPGPGGQGGPGGSGAEGGGMPPAGGFGRAAQSAAQAATTHIDLSAPVTVSVIAIAVGLAILGGLLAGGIGGWRASRLRPAQALRSVQ